MRKKVVMLFVVGLSMIAGQAFGGWLDQAISGAIQKVSERAVEEATDGAYEGAKRNAKEVMEDDLEEPSELESEKAAAEEHVMPMEKVNHSSQTRTKIDTERRQGNGTRVDLPHFSARLVTFDPEENEEYQIKIYAGGAKWRMEPIGDDAEQGISITDLDLEVVYMISSEEKSYLEFPYGEGQGDGEDILDLIQDGNPCSDYRLSEKKGAETLNGRRAVKWVCREPLEEFEADTTTIWVDDNLHMPLRTEDSDGYIGEMRDIREGEQSPKLFQVPVGYEKVSMPFAFFGGGGDTAPPSGDPIAPKADIPTNRPVDETKAFEFDLEVRMLKSFRVPAKSEVGIPAYPGAKALKLMPAGKGKLNGEPFESLPVVELITMDDPKKVAAWYRNKLGWQEEEFLLNAYFWPGGEFHPLAISGMEMTSVGVLGIPENILSYYCMPGAKTTIQIRYNPRQ